MAKRRKPAWRRAFFDADVSLAYHHAGGFDVDRVEFDGGDFVDVGEQLRQSHQQGRQSGFQGFSFVLRGLEGEAAAGDHVHRQAPVERRQGDNVFMVVGAGFAEVDHRAEHGVVGHAQAQRRQAAARDAGPQAVAADAHAGKLLAGAGAQAAHGDADVLRRTQLARHQPVLDVAGQRQREVDRIADIVGGGDRGVDAAPPARPHRIRCRRPAAAAAPRAAAVSGRRPRALRRRRRGRARHRGRIPRPPRAASAAAARGCARN
jgi:hypothetical protein